MSFQFDAYVTAALFGKAGKAAFALGDGTIRFETGEVVEAHDAQANRGKGVADLIVLKVGLGRDQLL